MPASPIDIAQNFRRALSMVGLVIRGSADEANTVSPTLTTGTGVPNTDEPKGSIYLRQSTNANTVLYVCTGSSTWEAVDATLAGSDFGAGNPGLKADIIAESTAAAGVTVDGCLIKDGVAAAAATSVSVSTASGTGATGATAPAFTGTDPAGAVVDYAPYGGTGFATAGQVVTTTENKTLALNELANCWLITATQAPCLIVSNTAVNGAPAVLTVYGAAPVTDAGTYKILYAPTPAGTVASHTHTGPSHTH